MRNKRSLWVSLLSVVIISVVWLGATIAAGWSPKLGLDLDGGLQVVYQTHRPVNTAQLDTITTILGERVNSGTSGASVESQGKNQISVSIPGEKNAQQVLNTLGQTAELLFRPVECFADPLKVAKGQSPSTGAFPACSSQYQLTATNLAVNTSTQQPTNNVQPDPAFTTYACTTSDNDKAASPALLALTPNTSCNSGNPRYVVGPAQVTGKEIKSASAGLTQAGQWVVNITFNSAGATAWDQLAQQQFHAYIAMDLDGQIISAPLTLPGQSTFTSFNGKVQVSGSFTQQTAQTLASQLNFGALPVKLDRLTVQTVSPTLGKSSLQAGLISGLVGLLLVMLYIVFYYRLLGLVVLAGLGVTGAILWSLISLLGHTSNVTLNLAGIIGLIVSLGITVDSYIVYFERLKDEARSGRTIRTSVDRSFHSAFRTVLAADAVSLIGAVILYVLSVGDVKGFALFLGMSTVVDIVITYFFTRPFVILLGQRRGATDQGAMSVASGLGVRAGVGS
jgi:preprotein translocase subunit SecD